MQQTTKVKKILYVDDVSLHLLSLKARFQGLYEIYPAQNYEKMIDILERFPIDLILLDIHMPEIDGFETIKKLKSNPVYKKIPVIFLTSLKERKSCIEGIRLGAEDYITKPFTNEELTAVIEYQFSEDMKKLNKPVILAIDDNPSILQSINAILSDNYIVYTVPEVRTDSMLKEILKKMVPDLFMLDYLMPALSGFDLIPMIRKIPDHEETPIVILTSESSTDSVTAAISLGAIDFITKPIIAPVLKGHMKRLLADFILRRRIRAINEDRRLK